MTGSAAKHGLATVFRLYRQVMRVHRAKLPPPLCVLGNSYAQEEFRRHLKGNTTAAQWKEFGQQWQRYTAMLVGEADLEDSSGEIPDDMLRSMNDEQRAQLEKLKAAAEELVKGSSQDGS